MYQFLPPHLCDCLCGILIEIMWRLTKVVPKIWSGVKGRAEILVAVRSSLWVRVWLITRWLSRLERLKGIPWPWVQILLRLTFFQLSLDLARLFQMITQKIAGKTAAHSMNIFTIKHILSFFCTYTIKILKNQKNHLSVPLSAIMGKSLSPTYCFCRNYLQ